MADGLGSVEPPGGQAAVTGDEDLIDASEVAGLLGLSHRNSVSTYRSRYPDFPPGQTAGGGRTRFWRRRDIVTWQQEFRGRRSADGPEGTKLHELVTATARLMLANPGVDVSIRQIAAEAGVAHSDLYRYAISKEKLRNLAIEHITRDFATQIPADYAVLKAHMGALFDGVRVNLPAMSVVAHEMISSGGRSVSPPKDLAVGRIADIIRAHRADEGRHDGVDPRVISACLGAMYWGLLLFEDRWLRGLGLDRLQSDDVAQVARAMLEA